MKKFWKNLCVGALAVTSAIGLSGCGKDDDIVSKDLDGDNVISEWETLFEKVDPSDRVMTSNIEEISSLDDLKKINDSTEKKVYKLTKDIDCKGEAISINLKNSSLYGNNKVISNFKLGESTIFGEGEGGNVKARSLFYNGVSIYDLRVFMGHQQIEIDDTITTHTISPFVNTPIIDSVIVKGKISINRKLVNGLSSSVINSSLLVSSIEEKLVDLSVNTCSVYGDIYLNDGMLTNGINHIGGIIPYAHANDVINDCGVDCEINTKNSGDIYLGLIAGENDGFVTTTHTAGSITTSHESGASPDAFVGGIVGMNNKFAEIKNSSTTATINFNQERVGSDCDYMAGGIAGRNDGVISYATSDATLNVTNSKKAYLGGIAGYGEHAIYYNILSRGSLNPTKVENLFIADMVGYSKYGYFETAIVNTNININNKEINSKVYLGLLTIFENLESSFDVNAKFNAEFTPNFKDIVIGGATNVYMKSSLESKDFRYNLGLRNEYEYFELDPETGDIVMKESGEVDEETGEPILVEKVNTLLPTVYSNLQRLSTHKINKYKVTDQSQEEPELNLEFTYAENGGGKCVSTCDVSRVKQLSFFTGLGFKCGLGHNEIDVTSFDLNKIRFTLPKEKHLERYFRFISQNYNGELASYDKEFTGVCKFDITNELFSFINGLISSSKGSYYTPIKVSREFATTILNENVVDDDYNEDEDIENEENENSGGNIPLPELPINENPNSREGESSGENQEEVEDYLTTSERFGTNIKELLKLMGVTASVEYLDSGFNVINEESSEVQIVKYVHISFEDARYSYDLTLDVTEMTNDVDKVQSDYVIYLQYSKVSAVN